MMSVGVSEKNTEFEFYGPQMICNSSNNSIPRFSPNDNVISVSQFQVEALAYSFDTSTLVVCGGNQTAPTVIFFIFFTQLIKFGNSGT